MPNMRRIRRNIPIEIHPTAEELANAFWEMEADEQAVFFNTLGQKPRLVFQLQAITDSKWLYKEGRKAMGSIGDYAAENKNAN